MKNEQPILSLLSKLKIILFSIFLLMGQLSCAAKYQHPPSEDLRSKFGTIGIVFTGNIPESNFNTFAKGRLAGAGKGAAGGVAGGAAAGAAVGIATGPIGILLLPFLVGGGAVIGGVAGTVSGTVGAVPAQEAENIKVAISNALAALRIQETMSRYVLKASSGLLDSRFYPEPVPSQMKAGYEYLKEKGIDTAMELSVESVGFEGGKGSDPPIAFFMKLRERIVRISDNTVLYDNRFIYRSAERKFSLWYKDNARLLSEELERAYRSLAEKVVEETFLRYDLPK
jgi:hypothetical protein